ncbi:MAG: hypothetical protein BIFFINMI_00752 [Phycisphaerae bacterium]|nr:hypothetical protein [Phycisphaerae bacterium]
MRRMLVLVALFPLGLVWPALADDKAPAPPNPEAPRLFGHLGVAPGPVSEELGSQLGLEDGRGVRVVRVQPDSPAAKAGLRVHDVLTMLDDQILFNDDQLRKLVSSKDPGTKVTLTLIRRGRELSVGATLDGSPERAWGREMPEGMFMPPPGMLPLMPDLRPERPGMQPGEEGAGGNGWDSDRLRRQLDEMRRREREALERLNRPGQDKEFQLRVPEAPEGAPPDAEQLRKEIEEQMRRFFEQRRREMDRFAPPTTQPDEENNAEQPGPALMRGQGGQAIVIGPAGGMVQAQGQGNGFMASAMAASANYRCSMVARASEPPAVSLYDREGKAIFENRTPDQARQLARSLDPEARQLVENMTQNAQAVDPAQR